MATIDELQQTMRLSGDRPAAHRATFLPEPERRRRQFVVFSVDDHIVEPPDTFEGRLPVSLAERGPRVVEVEGGSETWIYDDQRLPNVGFNAVAGRPVSEYSFEPTRFDEMRRGAWDIHERVRDMDVNGVWASVCFPSFLPGFAGQRLQLSTFDRDLALASVRAWNDWHHEVWAGSYPGRIVPMQLPWLLDAELGAQEIRKNAARGFKAVTMSEAPAALGLPSLHTGYWDPIMEACEETETVVCLHIGSSGTVASTAPDAPEDVIGALFFAQALATAVDWLYSLIPVRFPGIKIALAEGGIGWVAGLMDRLDHMLKYHEMYGTWVGIDHTPREVLARNFWFCSIDDASAFANRDRIGVDHIVVESDYPHADSSWPDTQRLLGEQLRGLDRLDVEKITWRNAEALFRHRVPAPVVADPDALWATEPGRS